MPVLTPHPNKKGGNYHMTSGRNCIAAGNGLSGGMAGVAAIISVRCRDARNEVCPRPAPFFFLPVPPAHPPDPHLRSSRHLRMQPRTKGGDVILVSMTPETGPSADAHVIDNTDGTYTCTYLPTVASPNCRVSVTVNGTHVVGSPFPAAVQPGRTDAQQSEVFGHGLNDGVSGAKNYFELQTKDSFGNRCVYNDAAKDKFMIIIKPVHSLLPELSAFMRKYTVTPIVVDNEDGTHAVEYTCDYAGFYAIEVTFGNVPVGDSPYTACICNPTIAFPPTVSFEPLEPEAKGADTLPTSRACDMVQLYDLIVILKSQPVELTGGRREREYLHFYKLTSAMARGREMWDVLTLRGRMLPPPQRRECLALDQRMLLIAHSDDRPVDDEGGGAMAARTPLNHLRMLDLSDLKVCHRISHHLPPSPTISRHLPPPPPFPCPPLTMHPRSCRPVTVT